MAALLDKLLLRLALPEVDSDSTHTRIFIGGSGSGGVTANERLFGGLVAAQATVAAIHSVDAGLPLHSLHSYFLRPARADSDIEYHVNSSKDGRNFNARSVYAWQQGQLIFQLQASFQRPESDRFHHAPAMPDVADPETAPNRDQLRGRSNWREMPIDVRMLNEITTDQAAPAEQAVWIRANGALPKHGPEAMPLHYGLLVYASDRSLLDTAWRPHADQGELVGASLDHSIWFHQPADMQDWLLYDMYSPVAASSRGLAFGHMFSRAGQCVATVAQEGLLRVRAQRGE